MIKILQKIHLLEEEKKDVGCNLTFNNVPFGCSLKDRKEKKKISWEGDTGCDVPGKPLS